MTPSSRSEQESRSESSDVWSHDDRNEFTGYRLADLGGPFGPIFAFRSHAMTRARRGGFWIEQVRYTIDDKGGPVVYSPLSALA